MNLQEQDILAIISNHLSPEDIRQSLVYWDKRLLKRGDMLTSSPPQIVMPFDGTFVFVDLHPRRNWAHPCLYILINSFTKEVEIIHASFPPYWDTYPETFVIISRYGDKPLHGRYFQPYD